MVKPGYNGGMGSVLVRDKDTKEFLLKMDKSYEKVGKYGSEEFRN